MADITHAIASLYPDTRWQMVNENYNTLEWYSTTIPKPSRDELLDEVERLNKIESYVEPRKKEYPPVTDYLDAVVKGDLAQQQAYIDACLAVKAKYPKPEGV
jgi:hypothetical protein